MSPIRWATTQDYNALGRIMFTAIHAEPSPYSEAERHAWQATPYSGADWQARLDDQTVLIAETNDQPVGFMSLRPDGYVDLAFILPKARGLGLFKQMFTAIETRARQDGHKQLTTHASLAAEGPFRAVGFFVTERESLTIGDQSLRRAVMEKKL